MFVDHGPFGHVQAEFRRHCAHIDMNIEAVDCPILDCDSSFPGASIGMVLGLLFRAISPAGARVPRLLYRIFVNYLAHRERLFASPDGLENPSIRADARLYPPYDDLIRQLLNLLCACLCDAREYPRPAKYAVMELLEKKAAYAIIHHRHVTIGGLNLAEEFARERMDSERLLARLRSSQWFDLQNPSQSLFFTQLTAPGKAMDSVFNDNELAQITAWLQEPDQSDTGSLSSSLHTCAELEQLLENLLLRASFNRPGSAAKPARTKKELYFRLLDGRDYSAGLDAKSMLEEKLALSRTEVPALQESQYSYFRYTSSAFALRIDDIYTTQHQAWEERLRNAEQLSLETLKKYLTLFSPVALIDGAWLEGIPKYFPLEGGLTDFLFKIYHEEMGYGEFVTNHARIYGDLLRSVWPDFAKLDDLRSLNNHELPASAYELANISLCFSRFAPEFFPELLGWTLASELVGLAGGFQHLANTLKRHGLNPGFYHVHISADNLSSGHTRFAQDAIIRFVEKSRLSERWPDHPQGVWHRIWTGFRMYRWLDMSGPWTQFEVGAPVSAE
ncbi:iron-containing redox enzyme family protein [Bradyrhizobium genosp. A]|uniref:iron-containing redox enzyme family protein n=1 Tax=Bradyrhizobium genosp. A TaxID=83626 RepID=UPI003CF8A060